MWQGRGEKWSPPPGEVEGAQSVPQEVFPANCVHAPQLDFMPEGPRRIIPDATKLDP